MILSNVLDGLTAAGDAVWRASWPASVLALLVLAIHLVFGRRIPARWRRAMWLLVLVRLALPVVPSSPLSIFNLAPAKPAAAAAAAEVAATAATSAGISFKDIDPAAIDPAAISVVSAARAARVVAATPEAAWWENWP